MRRNFLSLSIYVSHCIHMFVNNSSSSSSSNGNNGFNLVLSASSCFRFECHDGEVNAVKYHKHGKYFATGGGDKKLKIWEFRERRPNLLYNLIGSNGSICCIDIDASVTLFASFKTI